MQENERSLLNAMMMDVGILAEMTVEVDQFQSATHRTIFNAIQSLAAKGVTPDVMAIHSELPGLDIAVLLETSSTIGSAANWRHYEKLVKEDWAIARLKILGKMLQEDKESAELIEVVEREICEITRTSGRRGIVKLSSLMARAIDEVERRFHAKGEMPGIPTGLEGFDAVTQGFQKARMYVIGARPSQGKSALALNMALHIAVKEKRTVGFLSLESSMVEMIMRGLSSLGRVESGRITSGFLSTSDFQKIQDGGIQIFNSNLYAWDQPNAKLGDCLSVARQMVRRYGAEVLFLDYAQIVRVPGTTERREAAEEVSMSFKELARELNIPIVLLAQLKRDADERRPGMGDFQWTSQFEQDADVACLIWHKYRENYEIEESFLLMDKVRDGAKAIVPVVFLNQFVTFANKARNEVR